MVIFSETFQLNFESICLHVFYVDGLMLIDSMLFLVVCTMMSGAIKVQLVTQH